MPYSGHLATHTGHPDIDLYLTSALVCNTTYFRCSCTPKFKKFKVIALESLRTLDEFDIFDKKSNDKISLFCPLKKKSRTREVGSNKGYKIMRIRLYSEHWKTWLNIFQALDVFSLRKHTFVSEFISVFNVNYFYKGKGTIYENLPEIGQHFVHERNVPGAPSHGHGLPFLFLKKLFASNRQILNLKKATRLIGVNVNAEIGSQLPT